MYDHALKRYRDTLNAMTGAEKKDIEKGRKEGMEKGKMEVARNMKAKGFDLADIMDATGLTEA